MSESSERNKKPLNSFKILKMQSIVIYCFILLISLSLTRCANMQRPTGGPKDSLPPELLEESTPNFTTNFTEKRIILRFDEFIKLNNEYREFSISPDVEEMVDYRVRKRNLVITLPDSLEENTTYTINFGKGLVDFNEGNPFIDYNYVFATGDELDSLFISGSVINGFTKEFDQKKDENIIVLLIPTSQDSIFGKRKANIFANVDTSGNFKFNNLREDAYRIYALKEQNNDRIFNGNDEWIGFLDDSLYLDQDITGIHLEITPAHPKEFRVLERNFEKTGNILLTFNKPLDNPTAKIIFPTDLDEQKIVRYSFEKDSAKIYLPQVELDSVKIELRSEEDIIDTAIVRVSRNAKFDRQVKPVLNITNKVDRVQHITLTSESPLAGVDKSKILIYEDSVSRRNFQLQRDSIRRNLYHIRYNWRPKRNYELVIEESAMRTAFDDVNEESKTRFTLDENDNYGTINFKVNGLDPDMNYIVELIDESKEKVFHRQPLHATNPKIAYNNYPGGKYSLRIIYDENNNGRWDPADVYAGRHAEDIWYLDQTFTIRANWDQNETITLP